MATTKKQVDAIGLLKEDHEEVRGLLGKLAQTTDRASKSRLQLLDRIGTALRAHARIEEEIFYPALKEAARTKEQEKLVHEAFEEHRAVEELVLPDLEKTKPDSPQFGGRAKVLKDLVEHHAEEEEEEMFPQVRKLFSKEELRDLGERMEERKKELLG